MIIESTNIQIKNESPNIANAVLGAVAFFRSAYKTNKNERYKI